MPSLQTDSQEFRSPWESTPLAAKILNCIFLQLHPSALYHVQWYVPDRSLLWWIMQHWHEVLWGSFTPLWDSV